MDTVLGLRLVKPKSSGPADTYLRQITGFSQWLVECMFGTKPLPEMMLNYCQLNSLPTNFDEK